MPATTSPEKVTLIEFHGGRCHFVERARDIYDEARRLAAECGGHQPDQFSNAERATDWRGNNNIAESIFSQLALERHPLPEWVVVGARRAARARRSAATCGTGGCTGRPRGEPSFVPTIVDRTIRVPDAASLAAMQMPHRPWQLHSPHRPRRLATTCGQRMS